MYKLINREEGSSVYSAVANVLLSRPDEWTKVHRNSEMFNLMFGERNKLPFARLGHSSGLLHAVNYYRGSAAICRKVPLVHIVRTICNRSGMDSSSCMWFPETFIIVPSSITRSKSDRRTTVYKDEREELRIEQKNISNRRHRPPVWIAKSSSGAKGKNILISEDVEEILAYIDQQAEAYIVQRYIENPLLLEGGRKFDVRCWVLLDHLYNIFVFSEGVLRTSSEPYVCSNYDNITTHLTNHCIQEAHSRNFGKFEDGNEMFFGQFSQYLKQAHGINFKEKILPQLHRIISECLLGVKEQINTTGLSYHSFQLFGFDFLIDDSYKVWLIEVNGAPACASRLLPDLAKDLVRIAIDPIFPSSLRKEPTDKPALDITQFGHFQLISNNDNIS